MDDYPGPFGILTGVLTFFGGWIYAIATYGWFLGLGLGWLPSIFIAVIAAYLWPLIFLAVGAVIVFVLIPMR